MESRRIEVEGREIADREGLGRFALEAKGDLYAHLVGRLLERRGLA